MFVSVEGANLFYSTRGKGPVCLILSSIGTKPYEVQMPASLSDHLTLVFVALRGSGESTGEAADLTFDVLASDLESIRHAFEVERVSVIGHSILGALAIEYARRCPDSVSHVITVGTPPKGDMAWLMAESNAYFEKHASEERKQALRNNLAAAGTDAYALFRHAFRRQAAVCRCDHKASIFYALAGAAHRRLECHHGYQFTVLANVSRSGPP